jgi:nucleotide-binding universal stress UspA family protein
MWGEVESPKRILCATDFSDAADAALDEAVALARPAKAGIRLVHVGPAPPHAEAAGRPPGIDEQTRAALVERLRGLGHHARAAGVETECVLRGGEPCTELVQEARHMAADLIVMGRHRPRTPDHWFRDSVVERVVRMAPCAVVVAEPPLARHRGRPPRVLCALDLGETSARVLAGAVGVGRLLEAELLVLHVAARPGEDSGGGAGGTLEAAGTRLADLVAGAAPARGRVRQRVVAGLPWQEILEAARAAGSDYVVVGSHAGGIRDRQFLGSTTLQLLRRSECAVVVVPAPVAQQEPRP